jgi:hypothetical protein
LKSELLDMMLRRAVCCTFGKQLGMGGGGVCGCGCGLPGFVEGEWWSEGARGEEERDSIVRTHLHTVPEQHWDSAGTTYPVLHVDLRIEQRRGDKQMNDEGWWFCGVRFYRRV